MQRFKLSTAIAAAVMLLLPSASLADDMSFMFRSHGVVVETGNVPSQPVPDTGDGLDVASATFKVSVNKPFEFDLRNLVRSDGIDPSSVTFAVADGNTAPAWLTLAADGLLSGLPPLEETVDLTVRAKVGDRSVTRRYKLEVFNALLAKKVVTGDSTTCAITLDDGAKCWGWGREGQLGNGNGANWSELPVRVSGLDGRVKDLAVGTTAVTTVCALLDDATVSCWGRYPGNGSTMSRIPVAVPGLNNVTSIAVGNTHACAAKTDGSVWCWGDNPLGQRGTALDGIALKPMRADLVAPAIVSLSAGSQHTCGLTVTGAGYCWGNNGVGQLGNGTRSYDFQSNILSPSPTATEVVGLTDIVQISAGYYHTCAIDGSWRVYCWGSGMIGELGDRGANSPALLSPAEAVIISSAESIAAGSQFSCAMSAGSVKCWGWGRGGRLGIGTDANWEWPNSTFPLPDIEIENGYIEPSTSPSSDEAAPVVGMQSGVSHISVSTRGGCGLMTDQRVKCWGENYPGRIGDGTDVDRWSPVYVRSGEP